MALTILEKLAKGIVILGDGAMGTQLYERGVYINRNYDDLNLSDSHLVKAIHRDYVQAGAQLLETNTFGANPFKLGKFGLSDKTYEINRAGAQLARRCADEGANLCVAGSIGPLGKPVVPMGKISEIDAHNAFHTQAQGLIDGGVDLLILETFIDLHEIRIAIQAIRELTDLPVIAMMTLNDSSMTSYGLGPEQIADALDAEPVEVIGINCSTGPHAILDAIKRIRPRTEKPIAAFPNAGEPKLIEGRILYMSTPEYFSEYTKRLIQNGVSLIGGCCGTTPTHIRFMASAIRALRPVHEMALQVEVEEPAGKADIPEAVPEKPVSSPTQRSALGKLLEESAFPVSCELHPPRSPGVKNILRQVRLLQAAGINVVNIPDGPRASARMSPMALAHIIMRDTGMDTILHYTCRDRNILGMQSDLLGAEALGIDNILAVTGDPPKLGDYPMATAVFDVDAIGLLRIADNLNRQMDLAGNPIAKPTAFFLGAGFNPGAIDLKLEIDRLFRKVEAGAEYILTQPVFNSDTLLETLEQLTDLKVPILVGVLPLASWRNAEFFHNEVPGMEVPDPIRERMKKASEKGREFGQQEGVAIAQEALLEARPHVQGVYIMPSFGKVELAIDTAAVLGNRLDSIQAILQIQEAESS